MSAPGAEPAFDDRARDQAARIYSLARNLLGSDADAEDITGEVLLRVVRRLHTFRGHSELTTWLHRVTVNEVLQLRRRRASRPERPATALGADGAQQSNGEGSRPHPAFNDGSARINVSPYQ